MKTVILALLLCAAAPQLSIAETKEGRLSGGRQANDVKAFEKEGKLDRDLLGRKIVVSPNAQIDEDSVKLNMAPWSTIILNVKQYDKGAQTTTAPFYRNVEMPE